MRGEGHFEKLESKELRMGEWEKDTFEKREENTSEFRLGEVTSAAHADREFLLFRHY